MTKIYEKEYRERLNTFLDKMRELPSEVKLRPVSRSKAGISLMPYSTGSTTQLVIEVGNNIPELLEKYNIVSGISSGEIPKDEDIEYHWANALAIYLGFSHWDDMHLWTLNNTRLWGSAYGLAIFELSLKSYSAFHRADLNYVINHWCIFVDKIYNIEEDKQNEV